MNIKGFFLVAAVGMSTLGATLFSAMSVSADSKPRDGSFGRRSGKRMERMAKELNLTPAQMTRLETIMKESRARSQKIRANQSLTAERKRAQMKAAREATRKRMIAVLTPPQRQKLAAMQQERRKQSR